MKLMRMPPTGSVDDTLWQAPGPVIDPRDVGRTYGGDPGQLVVRQGRRGLHHEDRPRPFLPRRLQIELSPGNPEDRRGVQQAR